MLKMYHQHTESGGSPAYWEEFGSQGTLADRLSFCDIDPLRPLFLRYLKSGSRMLEGGCGRGQYVAYYTARGAKVVGLDFARDWLTDIRAESPLLALCAGDVGRLPFGNGVFDVYYSGGVVEHFEGGAERALVEARRVLKPGGVLLISVPYFSPLRRMLAFTKRSEWRRVSAPAIDQDSSHSNRRFYQYAYTVSEFDRMLTTAGLRVLGTQGYAIVWGLHDVRAFRRLLAGSARHRGSAGKSSTEQSALAAEERKNGQAAHASLLKRLIVAEDASVPGAGLCVKLGRWACANMMMYICTLMAEHAPA